MNETCVTDAIAQPLMSSSKLFVALNILDICVAEDLWQS